jgi:cbb3-type cytochrome oxidase subunit 3
MDINDIRSAVTLLGFVLFVALWRSVWSPRRRGALDEAAQLPLRGEAGEERP